MDWGTTIGGKHDADRELKQAQRTAIAGSMGERRVNLWTTGFIRGKY